MAEGRVALPPSRHPANASRRATRIPRPPSSDSSAVAIADQVTVLLPRRLRTLGAAASLAALAVGCTSGESATSAPPALIGVALPTPNADLATMYRGVELAVERLNAEAGDGRAVRFAVRKPSPGRTSAVEIAAEMRGDPAVIGVVGHQGSGTTMDAAPVYEDLEHGGRDALAAISPAATSPAISGLSRWVFRVCPSDIAVSQAAARYVRDSLGARRAVIIYRNDAFGRDWSKAFAAAFQERGGVVLERNPYLAGITEWRAYAEQIRRRAPDVILFPGSAPDAEEAIRALRAVGVRVPLLGSDNLSSLEAKAHEYAGVLYTAFFDAASPPTQEGERFVAEYRRRFSEEPDQRAALAYDAALLIGRAARAVGPSRRAVRDYLERLGEQEPPVEGASGALAFDARHDVRETRIAIAAVGRGGGRTR